MAPPRAGIASLSGDCPPSQVLAIRKKVLGEEHPDFAKSLNNLAGVLVKQGKPEAAATYSVLRGGFRWPAKWAPC